jgi:hypothetical protein
MPGDSMDGGGSDGGNGDDQENSGDEEDDNDIPDSKEAPATAGALTAGGDSDSDDDNDNDSGGNQDNEDDDNDNKPTPEDAPVTSDAVTAKKSECPKDQEVALFSTSCVPAGGGSDSTQDSDTQAATACPPTSPTPTSYGSLDGLSVTNTVLGFKGAEIRQQDIQKSLLHGVQSPSVESKPGNPPYYKPPYDPYSCPPLFYEAPPSVLPYKGNEVRLINSYDIRDAKVTSPENTNLGFFTFQDGTIIEVTVESDPNDPSKRIRHEKMTPGSNTPLDRLGVVQVVLPSTGGTLTVPPNSKPGTGGTFLHKITYKDGSAIIASQTENRFWNPYNPNNRNENKEFWDVYDPNGRLKSTTMTDPATKTTAIENKQDNSVTFHPEGANSYTVYPRAADGTQKTVTVTSEGQPVVTVRDANGNVIPPKE